MKCSLFSLYVFQDGKWKVYLTLLYKLHSIIMESKLYITKEMMA